MIHANKNEFQKMILLKVELGCLILLKPYYSEITGATKYYTDQFKKHIY